MDSSHHVVQTLKAQHSCLDSVEINESNVLASIKKLENNYTSGPDGLPALFFKRLQHVIVKPITIIYNQLFSVAFVPSEWKKAVITHYPCS